MGQVRLDGQAVDVDAVDVRLDPWAQRAEAVQALGSRPLAVGELQVAGADVVDNGEAQDDVLPVVAVDVLARSPDHDGELALELDAGGPFRDADRGFGADDGCRGLQEDGRWEVLRALLEDLLDVVGIVAAHGNDLAGKDRREQPNLLDRPRLAGELRLAEWVISDFAAGGAGAVRLATLKHRECHSFWVSNSGDTHRYQPYLAVRSMMSLRVLVIERLFLSCFSIASSSSPQASASLSALWEP